MKRSWIGFRHWPMKSILAFSAICLFIIAYLYDADVRFFGAYYLHLPTSYVVRTSSRTIEHFAYEGANNKKVTFAIPRAYLPTLWDQHPEMFEKHTFSSIEVVADHSGRELGLLPYSFSLRDKFEGPTSELIQIALENAPSWFKQPAEAEQILQKDYLDKIDGLPRDRIVAGSNVFEVSNVPGAIEDVAGMQDRHRWFVVEVENDTPWVIRCHSYQFPETGRTSPWDCRGRFIDANGLVVTLDFPIAEIKAPLRLKAAALDLLDRFKAMSWPDNNPS